MSDGRRRLLAMAAVAVVVIGVAAVFVQLRYGKDDEPGVAGLRALGGDLFADGDSIAGSGRGILSLDGSNLAVLTPDGLGIVQGNEIRPVTDPGSTVVDAAWFANGSTLLVAEGPVPTGLLAVVDIDGHVRGSVPLSPSVGFGSGYGMAVAPGGRAAVVTAVDRPALGPEERRLVHVDLETGTTRDLTAPGGPNEERPYFLDAERVAYVETSEGGVRTLVVAVADGGVLDVADGVRVVGATGGGQPVLERAGEVLVDGRVVGRVPAGSSITSVHAATGLAVVAETVTRSDGDSVARLRRLQLSPST